MKYQKNKQSIDIAGWQSEEQFNPYPVGARDKSLVISPNKFKCKILEPKFLKPNFRYLYKESISRYPEQFWMEIFCYRFGNLLKIPVPPAHVAYDTTAGTCGALIEWFLKESIAPRQFKNLYFLTPFLKFLDQTFVIRNSYIEVYTPGGDILQRVIHEYDRKRGTQHNYETVARVSEALLGADNPNHGWVKYWVRTFIFDALIGNTDRHQDNWGVIWKVQDNKPLGGRLTPVFDNGTSMGHEIFENKFLRFDDPNHIERYIKRGTHHMKWKLSDANKISHLDIVSLLINRYPDSKEWIREMLEFSLSDVNEILQNLSNFNISVPLTDKRANFMFKLVSSRKEMLTNKLLET